MAGTKSRFSVEAVFRAIDRLSEPVARMEGRTARAFKKMEKGFRGVNRMADGVVRGFKSAGLAVAALGAAMTAVAVNVGSTGADFGEAMSAVGAVSLKSREEIAALEERALSLGESTKFTATQVANGMELMARSGFEQADILSGIEGVLAAAAAEGAELADTAGTVSKVLKGMGLETSQASEVADILALASARTNSTISTLGESMKNVAPTAKQFGIGLEDAVGAVALLQDVGLDASEAGNATKTMLTKLAKPSKEVAGKMEDLGVTFQDAKGDMLPLVDVMQNLQKASQDMGGNMEVAAFMADLVGLRGQKAALQLQDLFTSTEGKKLVGELEIAGKSVEELREQGVKLTPEMEKIANASEEMAELKMDNLKGDMLELEAAVDGVKIALFETQDADLRQIAQSLTSMVGDMKDPAVNTLKDTVAWFVDNSDAIKTWADRLGRALAVLGSAIVAIKVATAATAAFNLVLAMTPLGMVVTALTVIGTLIAAYWPEIVGFFTDLKDGAKEAWLQMIEFGLSILPIGGYVSALWSVFEWMFGMLEKFAPNAAQALSDAFGWAVEGIAQMWQGLWDGIVAVYESAIAPILDSIMSAFSAVGLADGGGEGDSDDDAGPEPQVVTQDEKISRQIIESRQSFSGEITVRDDSGRAEVTNQSGFGGMSLAMDRSGAL